MKFEHASPLTTHDNRSRSTVHLLSYDGKAALCGAVKTMKMVRGVEIRVLYVVDEPANCTLCNKALEMVLRNDLRYLNIDQMEEVGELVSKLRSNGAVQEPG